MSIRSLVGFTAEPRSRNVLQDVRIVTAGYLTLGSNMYMAVLLIATARIKRDTKSCHELQDMCHEEQDNPRYGLGYRIILDIVSNKT